MKTLAAFLCLTCLLCSTAAASAPYDHYWSMGFGDAADQFPRCLTVDSQGNSILAGSFEGSIDLGGGPLISAGLSDIFIAKFSPSGILIWCARYGDSASDGASDITVDGADNICLAGRFQGAIDFGGGVLTSAGDNDIFLTKLDATGGHIWSQRFGDDQSDIGSCIITNDVGDVYLSGQFRGGIIIGPNHHISQGGTDSFLAKFKASGEYSWSQAYGGPENQQGGFISSDLGGNLYLAGIFRGNIDFGGGVLTGDETGDIYLAKMSSSGSHIWSQGFYGDALQNVGGVAIDGAGNPAISGNFENSLDFGGGPLVSAGTQDIYIAKFDSSGSYIWANRYGQSAPQRTYDIATDSWGNILLTGSFEGTVDFGGGTLASQGDDDIFLARFSPSGIHQWSTSFGDWQEQKGTCITASPNGDIISTGWLCGTVDFGGGPISGGGAFDIYLVKYGFTVSGIEPVAPCDEAILNTNFPNPFNPATTIVFHLPRSANVTLQIYDLSGRLVRTLLDGDNVAQGKHEVVWTGCNESGRVGASGVYFYRLITDGAVATKKMILLE